MLFEPIYVSAVIGIGVVAMIIIVVIMFITRPITRSKLKIIAILLGVEGISCLYTTYFIFNEGLLFFRASISIVGMMIIAEIVLYQKYRKLGNS